jgi:hypothetical protein
LRTRLWELEQLQLAEHGLRLGLVLGRGAGEDLMQLVPLGERHVELEEEAIELGLGQRVGALHLQRVLRREHQVGPLEPVRLAAHRDAVLLHRLEQRALCLWGGSVDLVRQDDVRKDGAWPELEGAPSALRLVDDGRADDVGRHQVRCELDAREGQAHGLGQAAHEHGLAQARHALEQRVGAGQHAGDHAVDDQTLADDDATDLLPQRAQLRPEPLGLALHLTYVSHDLSATAPVFVRRTRRRQHFEQEALVG